MSLLHIQARAEHLAILRIAVFGVWLGLIATLDMALYAHLPGELIQPRGFARLLPLEAILASPSLIILVQVAAVVGCAACVAGIRPYPLLASVTTVLIFFHDAAMKSVGGYPNHAQTALLICAAILVLFPAADAYSVMGRRAAPDDRSSWLYRTPLMVVAGLTTMTYSFIGVRRLFVGGLDVFVDDSVLYWTVGRTLQYGAHGFDLGLAVLEHGWLVPLAAVGMFVTTVFEIFSPLSLRYSTFRRTWLVVIGGFHLATLLTMNIFFWENLVLLAVLFTGLPELIVRRTTRDTEEVPTVRRAVGISP